MSRTSRAAHTPAHVLSYIEADLSEISRTAYRRHHELAERLVVSCGVVLADSLPDEPVDHSEFRLTAVSWRICGSKPGRGAVQIRTAPATRYRAVIDLPGTGNVSLAAEATYDLVARRDEPGNPQRNFHKNPRRRLDAAKDAGVASLVARMHEAAEDADPGDMRGDMRTFPVFYFAFSPGSPPALESTYTAEEWAAAESTINGFRCWPLAMFARVPLVAWPAHPVHGGLPPGPDTPVGTRTADGWIMTAEGPVPAAQLPAAVLVDFSPSRGRQIRNPARAALVAKDILSRAVTFSEFRDRHSRRGGAGRVYIPTTTADPLARRLADLSPIDAERLIWAVRDASVAAGYRPDDGRQDDDVVAELLADPARPVADPVAASIHVVRLAGPPSPETLLFRGPGLTLDLYDLGDDSAAYVAYNPHDRVASATTAPWLQPSK